MDYSEILIRLDQHINLYRKAVQKKQLDVAQVYAKAIHELAADLLFATRGMK